MTEEEGLASDDLGTLSFFAWHHVNRRRRVLLSCAVCRLVGSLDEEALQALSALERGADEPLTMDEILDARYRVEGSMDSCKTGSVAWYTRYEIRHMTFQIDEERGHASGNVWYAIERTRRKKRKLREAAVALVKDVVGNPYRPITINPSWLTTTVLSLAQGMYESRDFSAMPILADALGDAGCEDEAILMHCRGAGPHCRGCHVIDALTGHS